MIERMKQFVNICFLVLIIVRIIYVILSYDFYHINCKAAKFDPEFMPKKQLFALLDSCGEVYDPNDDHQLLVRLAKSKVQVEVSDPQGQTESSETSRQMDLHLLSIEELKHLLNVRGIKFYSKSSKQDLMTAVNISGPVTKDEIDHMNRTSEPKQEDVIEFRAFNLNKTLKKYNETTIILIHIIPGRNKYAYFNKSSWRSLRKKLTYMGFKFGELECEYERSICLRLKWMTSVLYLYIPGGERYQFPISEDYDIHAIFRNIQNTLASRIKQIKSWNEFTSSEWALYKWKTDDVRVRVIYFTNMTESPMFLSVLSVKYRDEVNFGLVNMEKQNGRFILKTLNLTYWPVCLIVTKQSICTYGRQPEDYFTRQALDNRLQKLITNSKIEIKWYECICLLAERGVIILLICLGCWIICVVTEQRDDSFEEESGNNERNNDHENNNQEENTRPGNPSHANANPELYPDGDMEVRHRVKTVAGGSE